MNSQSWGIVVFGGRLSQLVMFPSEQGLLWYQLCNKYFTVYHHCQELTLLQQETTCLKFGGCSSFRRLWTPLQVVCLFVCFTKGETMENTSARCVTQKWNGSKEEKTDWRGKEYLLLCNNNNYYYYKVKKPLFQFYIFVLVHKVFPSVWLQVKYLYTIQ